MGPRAGLDGRKISSPPGFDPGPSSPVDQSLYRLSYGPISFYVHHIKYTYTFATFEVLTAVLLKIQVFWDVRLFSCVNPDSS